jgi:hypothetical protein
MPGMLDLSQLTPDQLNSLGWLAGTQWGGSSPYSLADAEDPMGPLAANDADTKAAAVIARRMRQQSPSVPPPEEPAPPDDSVFASGSAPVFGSLAPPTSATPVNPSANLPASIGAASPSLTAAASAPAIAPGNAAAPPLPAPITVKNAPTPINLPPVNAPPVNNDLDNAMLPQNSTPTQGQVTPPAAAAATSDSPSLADKFAAGLANFGVGGREGGILGALSGAGVGLSTGQRFDPMGQANQTVQALVARGMSPDMARLAATNPAALNQILPQLLGAKQFQVSEVTDSFGNKRPILYNPVTGEARELNISSGSGGGNGQSGAGGLANLANVDSSLKGDDYLKQFAPEIQAAVKNYVNGESMPTGNPRQGSVQMVKLIAQKYGADLGQPVDDNTFTARHKAVTGLASTTPGSLGGQMTYARTSLNHLGDVADAAVDLNNSNGLGIAPLATMINTARGLTTDQAAKVAALDDAGGHYGQEITKYYAGSPGGEAERQQFQTSLGGTSSSMQLAAVLEQELGLATGKISKTQSTIDEALGPNSKYQVLRPDEQNDVARVQAAIAKLRGQPAPSAAAAPAAAAPGATAPGAAQAAPQAPNAALVRQNGHLYQRQPDGSFRAIQ